MRVLILVLVIMAGMAEGPSTLQAESASPSTKILVFPFKIHADESMAYLSEAAQEMLASRLAQPGKLEIIQETVIPSDMPDAAARFQHKDANYAVLGGLTIFGQEVSIDANVIEAGKTAPVMVFHEYGRVADGVLIYIEKLAERIHKDLLDKAPSHAVVQTVPKQPATTVQTAPKQPAAAWRSRRLTFEIVGLGVGDITGDGMNELVTADEHRIRVHAYRAGKLIKLYDLPQKSHMKIIGIDVADINANRKAEIILTMIRTNGGLSSAVLEWNGSTFVTIESGLEYFFRVHTLLDGEKSVLTGQKEGSFWKVAPGLGEKGLFVPGVYRFDWQDQHLIPGNLVDLPHGTNIYWFASGDIMGAGQTQALVYTRKDFLRLLAGNHEEEVWQSSAPYGGSLNYLETKPETNTDDEVRHYLNQRILLTAEGGNDKPRVVVIQNQEAGKRLFSRFRKFTGGWIKILSWNGTALQTDWQTERLSGYISDMAINDLNNDGRMDIICALTSGAGSFSSKQTNRIMMFPMPALEP